MTNKEIESYRQQLRELIGKLSDVEKESKIKQELQKLARKVGASTAISWANTGYGGKPTPGEADTSVLIYNIHQALQTETMINTSKSANRNFWIALIATIIALGSAVALWVAILYPVR